MILMSSFCDLFAVAVAEVPAVVADVHVVHETAWPFVAVDGAAESSHDGAAPRGTTRLRY